MFGICQTSRHDEADELILITGATTGIGLALTRLLLEKTRHPLLLTARQSSLHRFAELDIYESERVHIRPLDVRDGAERQAVIDEANARWGGVDILVNNAGLAWRSVVEHVDEDERIEQMHVNFRGPMGLIVAALPGMRARGHGRIINVSSVAGMMAMPTMGIYSASKWALEGMSEALWYEMKPWNIHVTLVAPGFVHSESFENTRYTVQSRLASNAETDPYHAHYTHMEGFIANLMQYTWSRPEDVARRLLKVIRHPNPPLRTAGTWDAAVFSLLRRLLPRGMYHGLLYRMLPGIHAWGPSRKDARRTQPLPEFLEFPMTMPERRGEVQPVKRA